MKDTNRLIQPEVLVTDFDRTLTYLYKDPTLLPELANRIRSLYGRSLEIPREYVENEIDGYMVWHKLHDIAVKNFPKAEADRINKQAEDVVTDFELQIVKRVGLFPGVPEAVRQLRSKGIRLGLVSSNATSVVQYALLEVNILTEFTYVDGRPYPFHPELIKPNPYPLNKALAAMNADQASFWYVGDDKVDMVAAKAANVTAVGVCTGRYLKEELLEAGADMVLASFMDIPSYF
ncbi:HAD family hydrolase [Mobilitalea sibirica]|uniref:HAD family hydrolase n=1 Tax=Mobilitalea sibirica TaxID=1462919 RepID=A0A8J7HC42_9FIRM|nr:HAD family hydrolase [Mobilitalea sibirica]MBH1940627.1 HAD family hydrolase [Mobilitalea sibirica]